MRGQPSKGVFASCSSIRRFSYKLSAVLVAGESQCVERFNPIRSHCRRTLNGA
jgi:hypothetical protein